MIGVIVEKRATQQDECPSTRSAVIIGLPGVGKSTIGRRAAQRLGWRFVDLDAEVESRAGMSISEIFSSEGEKGFRDRESLQLADVLGFEGPQVIATGGGVVLREENRKLIGESALVVWMTAELGEIEARLKPRSESGKNVRPLLEGDAAGALRRLHDERSEIYASLATNVLSTSTLTYEDSVEALHDLIKKEMPEPASKSLCRPRSELTP